MFSPTHSFCFYQRMQAPIIAQLVKWSSFHLYNSTTPQQYQPFAHQHLPEWHISYESGTGSTWPCNSVTANTNLWLPNPGKQVLDLSNLCNRPLVHVLHRVLNQLTETTFGRVMVIHHLRDLKRTEGEYPCPTTFEIIKKPPALVSRVDWQAYFKGNQFFL